MSQTVIRGTVDLLLMRALIDRHRNDLAVLVDDRTELVELAMFDC